MADVKFQLKSGAVAQLLKGEEIQAELEAMGSRVVAAAGPGNESELYVGKNRARVTVRTATFAAMENEAKHRTLTAALNAARG